MYAPKQIRGTRIIYGVRCFGCWKYVPFVADFDEDDEVYRKIDNEACLMHCPHCKTNRIVCDSDIVVLGVLTSPQTKD